MSNRAGSVRRNILFSICSLVCAAACSSAADTSAPVDLSSIAYVIPPSAIISAGVPFDISVQLYDADGKAAANGGNTVTLSLNSTSVIIIGSNAVRASHGIAKFNALTFAKPDSNLLLTATSGSFTVQSAPFRIRAGPPSAAKTTVSPSLASVAAGDPIPTVITFRDALGNAITSRPVTMSLATAGVTFSPATGTTKTDGTFATMFTGTNATPTTFLALIDSTPVTLPLGICVPAAYTFPGVLTGTVTTSKCVASARANALYKFTMAAQGGATFTITSAFSPWVEVRTDPVTDNIVSTPQQGASVDWLLPAGTYQLRVGAASGGGTFTATGVSNAGNTGCKTRVLVKSGVYAGQKLEPGDCASTEDGSLIDKFVIFSSSGCGFTVSSGQFAPWLFVFDAMTTEFVDGRGGDDIGEDEHVGFPACTYRGHPLLIWVNADPGLGGTYTLNAIVVPPANSLRAPTSATFDDLFSTSPALHAGSSIMDLKAAVRARRR